MTFFFKPHAAFPLFGIGGELASVLLLNKKLKNQPVTCEGLISEYIHIGLNIFTLTNFGSMYTLKIGTDLQKTWVRLGFLRSLITENHG